MILASLSPDFFTAVVATVVVRATAILAAAWLLTTLLRRAAAATRHVVWIVALASLMLLPAVSLVLPRWEMPARADAAPTMAAMAASEVARSEAQMANSIQAGHHDAPAVAARPVLARRGHASVPAVVVIALWALGLTFGFGRLSAGWAAARRLVGRAVPMGGEADRLARELAAQLGIARDVRVKISDTLTVPVNCGLVRPVILLPAAAADWTADRLRVVLLHELAHVRRWDYASLLVMESARAMYWMNPLVWLAARRANVELERACDDEVLRAGTRSLEYAEHLYEIAASLAGGRTPSGALAMAQPSTLRSRVGSILAGGMNRAPLGAKAVMGAATVALGVGMPLSSVRIMGEGRNAAAERASISALSLPEATERARAAYDLGIRRAVRAREALIVRLRDADPSVRGMAAWALGAMGGERREVHDALVTSLRDPDQHVREMTVLALGALKDKDAVEALAALRFDSAMGVRGVLTTALKQIGGMRAGEELGELLLHDGEDHVRDMAAWNLRFTLGPDAAPWLMQALHDSVPFVRGAAARNLAEIGDPRAFEELARTARTDRSPMVRGAAAWALGALKDARAAEPLGDAMRDSVWNVRVSAADALGQTPGPRALELLIAATRDPVHQVQLTAVEALNIRTRS